MKDKSKTICVGLLAHVDAGKTTLSEAILYRTGEIRRLGRVDHGDSYLDENEIERNRGITVFSKQASFTAGSTGVTVLDTPGHVDFSAEMERVLSVLDYALLIISASEGIQSHTETLWRLLRDRNIPVIVFINKMDLAVRDRQAILEELEKSFGSGFVDFSGDCSGDDFIDDITLNAPHLADKVLMDEALTDEDIAQAIANREIFPCCFGSALRLEGIETLLECIDRFTIDSDWNEGNEFGARIFKVMRDRNDERLTFMRLTGGTLRSRETIDGLGRDGEWHEKVNQIRVYSGMKYDSVDEVGAGAVCAVTGLSQTLPGDALGAATRSEAEELEPIIMHSVTSAVDANGTVPDSAVLLKAFRLLEEEDPKLHVAWDPATSEITLRTMGSIQLEVLQQIAKDRFDYEIEFGPAKVVYLETISHSFEGVGHFEPLRHYAEVHLILEPAERGSGITYDSIVPEDVLARNWQRLILTHLEEKEHTGVLIGAPVTDMKITLAAGRAHDKHTNGGDFREATYRAVRQGLMQARAEGAAVLLEPYTDFRLVMKPSQVGRVMTDLEQIGANIAAIDQLADSATLEGRVPSGAIAEYIQTFTSITGGQGRISLKQSGYEPCHNTDEVLTASGYDPERDIRNPSGSVFVSHSESDIVPWDEVPKKMHIQSVMKETLADTSREIETQARRDAYRRTVATDKELRAIFERTYGAAKLQTRKSAVVRRYSAEQEKAVNDARNLEIRERHMHPEKTEQFEETPVVLIDGYNLINADRNMAELAQHDIGAARDMIIDRLINYQGYMKSEVIVVFDAYKVNGNVGEDDFIFGVHVIYTAQDEPADIRIGKMAAGYNKRRKVTIVSSDGLVQQNALVNNALRTSSAEFLTELGRVEEEIAAILKE